MFHLITGGSGSGKSAYAEEQMLGLGDAQRIYIATMHPFDKESMKRIEKHRIMRSGKGFRTEECYTHVEKLSIPKGADVLLECMSNLTANEMYEENGAGDNTVKAILDGIACLRQQAGNLIIVTNEICSDIQDYSKETHRYMRYLGEINRCLARDADRVTEVVYGIPLIAKTQEAV